VIYEPLLLLPVLNTVFLFLVACVVAYNAWRSYLLNGAVSILWLGCGVLAMLNPVHGAIDQVYALPPGPVFSAALVT